MDMKLVKQIMIGALGFSLAVPSGLFAEQPTTEQLLETIKKLEERVAELESKSGKTADSPAESTSKSEAPAVTAEIKKEVGEIKKESEENAPILNFFKSTQVSGFVDGYYGFSTNRPSDQAVQLRGLTTNHNSFQFNLAKLAFNRATNGPNSLGYRVDLVYGPAADSYHSYEPVSGQQGIIKNIQQAYLSYVAPVGSGLTVDVGKFATFIGAEALDTIDNWNYQQGMLFSYAQPYYHTGLRATYAASDKVGLGFYLVNGWNNSFDNNTGKSIGFSFSLTPNSKFQIIQNYLGGPEISGTNDPWRHLFDTVVNATINENVALKFNYDYGFDNYATGKTKWQGVAASIRFSSSSGKVAFAPRFEYLADNQGFATGAAQRVKGLTLTNEYRLRPNFSTKLEYRYDFSTEPYFVKRIDDFVKDQHVFMVGLVYAFGFGKE
ncbi:MAG: porin [Acidobacteriota bacterium]